MYQVTYFHKLFGTTARCEVQCVSLKLTTLIFKLRQGVERQKYDSEAQDVIYDTSALRI